MFIVVLKEGPGLVIDADELRPGGGYIYLCKQEKKVALIPMDSCLAIYMPDQPVTVE